MAISESAKTVRLVRASGVICNATTAEFVTAALSSSRRFAREIRVADSGVSSASGSNTGSVTPELLSVC